MSTRRETDHADSLRVDAPSGGPTADEADRPLGIEQRTQRWLAFDISRPTRTAVLEDDSGHALRVEPCRDFLAFEFPEQVVIPAPRTNQHRRSGVLFFGRKV